MWPQIPRAPAGPVQRARRSRCGGRHRCGCRALGDLAEQAQFAARNACVEDEDVRVQRAEATDASGGMDLRGWLLRSLCGKDGANLPAEYLAMLCLFSRTECTQ